MNGKQEPLLEACFMLETLLIALNNNCFFNHQMKPNNITLFFFCKRIKNSLEVPEASMKIQPTQEREELRNRDWVLMTLQIHSLYALATLKWVVSLVSKRILMETWFWFSRNLVLRSGRWTDIYNDAVIQVCARNKGGSRRSEWKKILREMLCLSQVSCGSSVCRQES